MKKFIFLLFHLAISYMLNIQPPQQPVVFSRITSFKKVLLLKYTGEMMAKLNKL
jgi:hypothetical protein